MRRLIPLLLLFAPLLSAQEQKPLDIALAYPATTMVYGVMDHSKFSYDMGFDELLRALDTSSDVPPIDKLITERLKIELTPEELASLTGKIRRSSIGLLDMTVTGPKLQLVIDHPNLAFVTRALDKAIADGKATVPEMREHYGTNIYTLYVPPTIRDVQPDMGFDRDPVQTWLQNQDFWVSVYENRFLILSNSYTAVTDSLDFLSFPDDPTETLIASSRYREAVNEHKDPHALLYVSIESIITAAERIAGDKGNNPFMGAMPFWWWAFGVTPDIGFMGRLMQYEQFKSFAAAAWLDEQRSILKIDMGLTFHNAPGWYEALRIEPRERAFTDLIPAEATVAVTDCVSDSAALYKRFKDFVIGRATTAGEDEVVKKWEEWEARLKREGVGLEDLFAHLGPEQGAVVLPRESDQAIWFYPAATWSLMYAVKDFEAVENFLHDKLLASSLGEPLRKSASSLASVEVYRGVEIHRAISQDEVAFALMRRKEGAGVLAVGLPDAIKRIIDARDGQGRASMLPAWASAEAVMPETSSIGVYMNSGSLLDIAGHIVGFSSGTWWMEQEDADKDFNRDDTEKDQNRVPYLADFFRRTPIVGAMQSSEKSVRMRFALAGWPSREEMQGMAKHFRAVRLNVEVRDDLLRVREGAFAHFAIQGKPPTELSKLVELGYVRGQEVVQDPFGEEQARPYLLAPVPEDVDSRQAILLAYQGQPGIRGNHLAVLWNTHIVELTPDQLTEALARAAKGEALADNRYSVPAAALFNEDLDVREYIDIEFEEPGQREVVIIDEEGNESTIEAEPGNEREATERALDMQKQQEEGTKEEEKDSKPVE